MKKFIGILVLGLLLSSNANAGWFSKLPILKCAITSNGVSVGTSFYNLRDDYVLEGTPEAKGSDRMLLKPTKREYHFSEWADTDDGQTYVVSITVDRYTGGLRGMISQRFVRGEKDELKKFLNIVERFIGTCEEVK